MKKVQFTITIPELLANEIKYYIDGVKFRNRSHIVHQAIAEWIDRQAASRKKQLTIDDAPGMKKPVKAKTPKRDR